MARKRNNFLETPDSTLYYEVSGASTGVPLFILHGGPGVDHSYFQVSSIWGKLGSNRPVVFYDQRGTGKSSVVEKGDPCTLANQLADFEALREHLGYERVDLLGHSWGGFLGMAYTARYPTRVRRLILVDSAAPRLKDTVFLFKNVFPETVQLQESFAFAIELGDQEAVEADVAAYLSMLCSSPEKSAVWEAASDPSSFRAYVNRTLSQDAERFDLNPELAKFNQPVLVTTGRYDINVAPSVAYEIHKAIPNSVFSVFERSGHLPFFEEPDEFFRVVEQFLSES